jgi:hypothetical protein
MRKKSKLLLMVIIISIYLHTIIQLDLLHGPFNNISTQKLQMKDELHGVLYFKKIKIIFQNLNNYPKDMLCSQ